MNIGWAAMTLEGGRDFRHAGIARTTFELIDAGLSQKRGHKHHLFLMPSFEAPDRWCNRSDVTIHRMWPRYNRWMATVAGAIAMRLRLDAFFSSANAVPTYGPTPKFLLLYDLFPIDHPDWYSPGIADWYRARLGHAAKVCTLMTAISESTKEDAVRVLGADPRRIVVTPLGPGQSAPPSGTTETLPFERYLLTLSTIEPRKNVGRLFEAFARLIEQPEHKDLGLVVAGGKGWMYDEALARVDELGIGKRVALLGYVEDERLPALFAGCLAYVCPSLTEGFGLPVLEAMRVGTLVASSSAGALREVGGEVPIYFDPLDVTEMVHALDAILKDPVPANRRKAGIARAAHFTWERCATLTLDAIEGAAKK